MSTFTQKKCPTCGGRLENLNGNQYECRSCHNVYELNERNANLYHDLQVASTFRESLNFKQAELMYKNLLKEYKDDNLADVYWNLLLCEQRVMFESNERGEQFPSFYDIVPTEIEESENYNKTIEYLNKFSPQNIATYVELVDKMYTAKRKCRTIKNTSKPYDIFICFKKSKLDGEGVTEEYKLAFDLYNILSKDYNVFFSERSLNNIVVREYEPNIYHALYTAKIMLVLCSKREYLESQWVKNEWSRFKMFSTTTSQTKAIIPIFMDGFQESALPDEIRTCQGIRADYSLTESLKSAVKAILNPADKQAELAASIEAKMQAKMQEQMQAQMEAFKKQFAASAQQNSTNANQQNGANAAPKINVSNEQAYLNVNKTKIEDYAFFNNKDLTSFDIPKGVTHIGVSAFDGCENLRSVTIPSGVTKIDDHAFEDCISLIKIDLPNSVTEIGEFAFSDCRGLRNITLPKGIKRIKLATFCDCYSLQTITIPETVNVIHASAFDDCANTLQINFQGTKSQWDSIKKNCDVSKFKIQCAADKVLPPTPSWTTSNYAQQPNEQNYVVPYGTTEIIEKQFYDRNDLTTAVIPDTVKSIGSFAFYHCRRLTSVIIPDSVISIAENAFFGCTELTNVTLGRNIKLIDSQAFHECKNLKSLVIPDSVTDIHSFAFTECSGLASITVANGNPKYHSINNCIIETATKTLILGCKNSIIPTDGSVTSIGRSAFSGRHNGLISINIPASVTSIGWSAFNRCSELTSITIPDSVVDIGNYSFCDCNSITTATIPAKAIWHIPKLALKEVIVTSGDSIDKSAFNNYKKLTDITIPNSVTRIGESAFSNCITLSHIHYKGTMAQWKKIQKGSWWNKNTGKYIVHCTDGDIKKSIFSS